MGTVIIIVVLAIVVVLAVRSSRKHLKGEGGCCGGESDEIIVEKKELHKIIGSKLVHIEGMSCDNCRKHVERQFNKIDGVAAAVDWKKGTAVLSMEREVNDQEIRQALAWSDYKITSISPLERV